MSKLAQDMENMVLNQLDNFANDLESFVQTVSESAKEKTVSDPLFLGAEKIAHDMRLLKNLANPDDAFLRIRQISNQLDRMLDAL